MAEQTPAISAAGQQSQTPAPARAAIRPDVISSKQALAELKQLTPAALSSARERLEFATAIAKQHPELGVSGMRSLPIEVYQAVLASQAEAMNEFFRSWGESIAHNAEEDRKASQRGQEKSAEQKRLEQSRELAKKTIVVALGKGLIGASEGQAILKQLDGIVIGYVGASPGDAQRTNDGRKQLPRTPTRPESALAPHPAAPQTTLAAMTPPGSRGGVPT